MKVRDQMPVTLVTFISVLAYAPTICAAELSAYGTLTTEYIYRGLSISDRNPALQMGVDYDHDSNIFFGAWISTIDLRTANGGRDVETNFYAGYHHEISTEWAATWTLLRYAYPHSGGQHSYDHNEALLEISWSENYAIEYAYTNDVYGLGRRATHLQASGNWPLGKGWVIGANVGRNDLSSLGISDYFHGDIGVSVRGSRFTFDFRLYNNEAARETRFETANAGTRLVLSVSAAL